VLQSLADVFSLRVFHSDWLKAFRFDDAVQVRQRGLKNISGRQNDAPLDVILQFPNVPRPRITDKRFHYFGGNFVNALA
jgi:hypothetical protein